MSKEDHTFKRNFVEEGEHDSVEQKGQSKLDDFVWDSEEEESEGVPLMPNEVEINNCAKDIWNYISSHIRGDFFEALDDRGPRFAMSIECSLNALLKERFSDQWTLDSRLEVFQKIQDKLSSVLSEGDNLNVLNKVISESLPPSRKKFLADSIILYDDAMTMNSSSNFITAEIPVRFETIS